MGYGPRFEIPHTINDAEVTIVMRHPEDGDAAGFAKLLEDFTVQQFVMLQGGPTAKDEEEYIEKMRTDSQAIFWAVAARFGLADKPEDATEQLIGFTALHRKPGNRLSSGVILADRRLWGKGVAKLIHRLRTWYAFCELGAYAIDSSYIEDNVGSGRALKSVGYVEIGRRPRMHLTGGQWRDEVLLACYNPLTTAVLWPDGNIPPAVQEGLQITSDALEAARTLIKPR